MAIKSIQSGRTESSFSGSTEREEDVKEGSWCTRGKKEA